MPRHRRDGAGVALARDRSEQLQPLPEQRGMAAERESNAVRQDEVGRPIQIVGSHRMSDRAIDVTAIFEQAAGAGVELRGAPGIDGSKPGPQHLAEQMVIAEPLAVATERDEEEVPRALDVGEPSTRRLGLEQLVEQLGAHAIEHRRHEQEVLQVVGRAGEHLFDEVVGNESIAPGEQVGPAARLVAGEREGCEMETARPSLGLLHQAVDLAVVECEASTGQQSAGLVPIHGEALGGELAQMAAHPAAGEVDRRRRPTDEGQRHAQR